EEDLRKILGLAEGKDQLRSQVGRDGRPIEVDGSVDRQRGGVSGGLASRGRGDGVEGVVVRVDDLPYRGYAGGQLVDHQVVERRNEEKGKDANSEQRHDGEPNDAHHPTHDIGRTDAPRPPTGLSRPYAE